jgi:hypothetical protein
MLTFLDSELYPDDCEVVELPVHKQYVYLIHKNGSSSLRKDICSFNYKVYKNKDLCQLSLIDVYIRSPLERYISGVNTYLQHLQRDNSNLDYDTCLWFATRYSFLNRHYLPQFLWLVNLSRFISPDCKIRLRKFSDFSKITKRNSRAGIDAPTTEFEKQCTQKMSNDLELWLYIDQLLEEMCGSSYTFKNIQKKLQQSSNGSYDILLKKFIEVSTSVLS